MLSFVSETERRNIKQRQAEGIAAARARGVKFGRPLSELPNGYEEVFQMLDRKEISQTEAARKLNMPVSSMR